MARNKAGAAGRRRPNPDSKNRNRSSNVSPDSTASVNAPIIEEPSEEQKTDIGSELISESPKTGTAASQSAPPKMNKAKALRLLGLKGEPNLSDITVAYDRLFPEQLSNPRKEGQLTEAKVYLENVDAYKRTPILDLVAKENKKGERKIIAIQSQDAHDILLLRAFYTDMIEIGKTYLEEVSKVGAKPEELRSDYLAKGRALGKKVNNDIHNPVFLDHMMPLFQELVVDKPDDILPGSKVGPIEKLKQQKSSYGRRTEYTLEKLEATVEEYQQFSDSCQELVTTITAFNKQFGDNLQNSEASSTEDAEQIRQSYSMTVDKLMTPVITSDYASDAVKDLFKKLCLDQSKVLALQSRAERLASTTDPTIRSFIDHYDDYLQQIEDLKQDSPEAAAVLDEASRQLYELGVQYLLALQNPRTNANQLHQDFDKRYEAFMTKYNPKLQAAGVLSEYELIRSDLTNKVIFNSRLSFEEHIDVFEEKYQQYLERISSIIDEDNPGYQHMLELQNRVAAIGKEYLERIRDPENDVDQVTAVYQKDMKAAIEEAKTALTRPDVENLSRVASIIYSVGNLIKNGESKSADHHTLFTQGKENFEAQLDSWLLDAIPMFEGRNEPDPGAERFDPSSQL
ncbi:MAG: hypothetical protein NXI01_05615 [Gammaproteobacteria bacterium]|nr:hypothetical protein [Gammaproteobacteria bacterium]